MTELKQWLPDEELEEFKNAVEFNYALKALFLLEKYFPNLNTYDTDPSVEGDLLADKLNNITKEQLSEENYYILLSITPLCYKECRDALIELISIDPKDATPEVYLYFEDFLDYRINILLDTEKNPATANFINQRISIWDSYDPNIEKEKIHDRDKVYNRDKIVEQLSKTDPEQAFNFAINNKLHLDSAGILPVIEVTNLCEDARSKYIQIGSETVALLGGNLELQFNSDGPFMQLVSFVLEEKKYGLGFLNELITKIREKKSNEELFFANALIANYIRVSEVLDKETAKPFRDAANSLVSILIKNSESLYSTADLLFRCGYTYADTGTELYEKIGVLPNLEKSIS